MKKSNIIFIICHSINVILLALIASGLTSDIDSIIFEIYFVLALTIIPIALIASQIMCNKKDFDIEKDKYAAFVPFVAFALMTIIFGIKYALMLDQTIIVYIIALTALFVGGEVGLAFVLYKRKFEFKWNMITYILSYLTFAIYLGVIFYLSYYFTLVLE